MNEIEVVIRIPEEWIEQFKAFRRPSTLETIILQGTVLPKGHGGLIDAEKLLNTFWTYCKQGNFGYHQAEDLIKSTPTIIEADKEEKND